MHTKDKSPDNGNLPTYLLRWLPVSRTASACYLSLVLWFFSKDPLVQHLTLTQENRINENLFVA